ncbi:CDP-diacylglycerol--glycerol-3-phosphate 3-phosphatidyltransferase [Caproiciproducens galactitolivorans]|uniref:CDP-diacylglycerol--glycerol-3-phosphate 3-phosphatidyltransferase n=1 Tax=Caproiciproducens galactitolivorans TaxID=642589 RepID=A0A4Z0Y0M7_9FIRM|nr:CDP-diacylglycerol--glycerol-3-phosphate 3-phosphatidyltransferase [Caproiciproducens galactitolivorans]QEY35576.1 CDP-diacylglycerol--glycerol-3-phosphate 3-phosphatidyltransferase [Caproiciproducens galactitolivorans]TGJ77304.1 CDP-diacylglycerol--glycerol-3-phosphate 3-phosphatidyltransferase [Caproiciproducens galactitolivorans]
MNLPNKLTVMRIILVPFFVAVLLIPGIPHHYLWAAILFGAAALTDHYDGKLARKNNQVTNFGKFLDPLADKILVISALVCFVDLRLAATWCVLVIIAREFMVTSIRLVAVDSGVVIAANKWGKTKTVSQIIAIIAILLFQYVQELISLGKLSSFTIGGMPSADVFAAAGYVLILIATFFALLSGIIYIVQNLDVINTTK